MNIIENKNKLENEINKNKYQFSEESQKIRALELEKNEYSEL